MRAAGELSDIFNSPIGLRQGCNLSPIKRALFIMSYTIFFVPKQIDKTKIVVFKKCGNLACREKWHYGETELEVVNGYITYVRSIEVKYQFYTIFANVYVPVISNI